MQSLGPAPAHQPPPTLSQIPRILPIPAAMRLNQQNTQLSKSAPAIPDGPLSTLPSAAPTRIYNNSQEHSTNMGLTQQSDQRKRSAAEMVDGEVPSAKRQAVASAAINTGVRTQISPQLMTQLPTQSEPRAQNDLLKLAVEAEGKENRLAASKGAALSSQKRRERVEAIYRFLETQYKANMEKKRQEMFSLAQIESKRQKDENDQREMEATEQQRIAAVQEKDRLDKLRIMKAQEKSNQEVEQRKAARIAAIAEKKRRQGLLVAQEEEREHQEAVRRYRAENEHNDKRKAELQQDSNRNFHSYLETIKYWPLPKGERQNQYMRGLLANQRMPSSLDSDLAIAIKYAKEHWYYYRQYPRDLECSVQDAKAAEEKKREKEKN